MWYRYQLENRRDWERDTTTTLPRVWYLNSYPPLLLFVDMSDIIRCFWKFTEIEPVDTYLMQFGVRISTKFRLHRNRPGLLLSVSHNTVEINEEICKIHFKSLRHRCIKCETWLCNECLDFHSKDTGCLTINSLTAMKNKRRDQTREDSKRKFSKV